MKWFGRQAKPSPAQAAVVDPRRYEGRPLLIFLDNYVLSVIGALDPERDAGIGSLVRRQYGGGTDWRSTLKHQVSLPDDFDAEILALWNRRPKDMEPLAFMVGFSDANFLPYIDKIEHTD